MSDQALDAELAALKRVQRQVVSAANRRAWRAAVQHRTVRIAGILRTLPSILVSPTYARTRTSGGWSVSTVGDQGVSELVLEVVTRGAVRTIEDLTGPVRVRVLLQDQVALARLQELVHAGTVTVELPESAS